MKYPIHDITFGKYKEPKIDNPRKYVGGHWENGKIQFDFMISEGLLPHNHLLDIGCGCLRGGKHFISYLGELCYWGVEHNKSLVKYGYDSILSEEERNKKPTFIITDKFELEAVNADFGHAFFHYGIAKSVFTHMTIDTIGLCLRRVRPYFTEGGKFYATIFIGDSKKNSAEDSDTQPFFYSMEEIEKACCGRWAVERKGRLDKSRQEMLKFTAL